MKLAEIFMGDSRPQAPHLIPPGSQIDPLPEVEARQTPVLVRRRCKSFMKNNGHRGTVKKEQN